MNLFDFDIKQISETDPRNLGSIQWRQNWKRARPDGRAHFVLSSRSLEGARHVTRCRDQSRFLRSQDAAEKRGLSGQQS